MSIGNWKKHILVNCAACLKPMGYHVKTTAATCNDCERAARLITETPREKIERLYLSYFNDFLSVAYFAEYYGLSETKAKRVITAGRKLNHRRYKWHSTKRDKK